MSNEFLPSEAQEPKSKSNYTMPLDEGRHKLRVLSSAIVGYEGWKEEAGKKTPIRYKMGTAPSVDPNGKEPKYFWAFLCWNYDQERIQIMAVTQKTIREQMQDLIDDEVWNDPKSFDIVLTRKGTKLDDTKYTLMPNPKTDLDPDIKKQYEEAKIDLQEWMKGEDPFSSETTKESPYASDSSNYKPTAPTTGEVVDAVEQIFAEDPPDFAEPPPTKEQIQ